MFSRTCTALLTAALPIAVATASGLALRDPTAPYQPPRPSAARPAVAQHYVLTAVLVSAKRRVAIINGQPCMEGDRVDGAEIVGIEREQVRLRRGGKDIVLHLQKSRGGEERGGGSSQ